MTTRLLSTLICFLPCGGTSTSYAITQKTTYSLKSMTVDVGNGKVENAFSKETIEVTDNVVITDTHFVDRSDGIVLERFVKQANRLSVMNTANEEKSASAKSPLAGRRVLFSARSDAPTVSPPSDALHSILVGMSPDLLPACVSAPPVAKMEEGIAALLSPFGCFCRSDLEPVKANALSSDGPLLALSYLAPDQLFGQSKAVVTKESRSGSQPMRFSFSGTSTADLGSLLSLSSLTGAKYSHILVANVEGKAEAVLRAEELWRYVVRSTWAVNESISVEFGVDKSIKCSASWDVEQELHIEESN